MVASTLIGDDEAEAILRRCFPRYQGAEFKFKVLWRRREAQREGLRALARELPALADRIFLWIVNKRFCLLTKMFDYLVEPVFYARGYDFYGEGYAMRYMNTVHRDLLAGGGADIYDAATRRWNDFARAPSSATMAPLRAYLDEVAKTTSHPISTIFKMLHQGTRYFEISNPRLEEFSDTNEIQVTSVLSTVTHWRQRVADDIELVHDESRSFDRQQELWATIVRQDFTAPPFMQSNGSVVELPLRVQSTTAVRSEVSPAVQLADLLAGLGAKFAVAFDPAQRDPFVLDLARSGAGALNSGGVRPHEDYVEGPVPRRSGPDALDTMTDLLAPYLTRTIEERQRS